MHEKFLAIDIGASSGRHIIGWMEDGTLQTEEVYRFPNSVRRVDGHLEWDIDSLFANVKQGIKAAFAKYPAIKSLSIDTWAVDYVLLKKEQPLYPVYAYRDGRTQAVLDEVHGILPFAASRPVSTATPPPPALSTPRSENTTRRSSLRWACRKPCSRR